MIKYENKKIILEKPTILKKILKDNLINPLSVVAVKNGSPVSEEERIFPEDDVEIVKVISGGER